MASKFEISQIYAPKGKCLGFYCLDGVGIRDVLESHPTDLDEALDDAYESQRRQCEQIAGCGALQKLLEGAANA